jgi:hypothetical protein
MSSRYNTHPVEQEFQKWDREQNDRRIQYWHAIYAMRADYIEENKGVYDLTTRPTLHYYAELKYGIRMGLDGQGNYTKDYTVVDPKKFMLFQIKYMR